MIFSAKLAAVFDVKKSRVPKNVNSYKNNSYYIKQALSSCYIVTNEK